MFLDDELIKICETAEINRDSDVQGTYNKLIDACQDYYKERTKPGMKRQEGKVIIDRTFKLWDSFVREALKHPNSQVVIFGTLCEKHTFKNAFMNDPNLSMFYNGL